MIFFSNVFYGNLIEVVDADVCGGFEMAYENYSVGGLLVGTAALLTNIHPIMWIMRLWYSGQDFFTKKGIEKFKVQQEIAELRQNTHICFQNG